MGRALRIQVLAGAWLGYMGSVKTSHGCGDIVVVVSSGDDDNPEGSHASPDGSQAAGRKDTSAPEEFREKEQAEVKPRIAEESAEAEGIVERPRECLFMTQMPAEPRDLVDAKELRLCCPKFGSVDVFFEQGIEFSDAEYELRPAVACAAGTFPGSDRSGDAKKQDSDRVRENFSKHRGPFGG
ncbi:hypothetical protein MRX96_029006 [Rhipicephalus microplus]